MRRTTFVKRLRAVLKKAKPGSAADLRRQDAERDADIKALGMAPEEKTRTGRYAASSGELRKWVTEARDKTPMASREEGGGRMAKYTDKLDERFEAWMYAVARGDAKGARLEAGRVVAIMAELAGSASFGSVMGDLVKKRREMLPHFFSYVHGVMG